MAKQGRPQWVFGLQLLLGGVGVVLLIVAVMQVKLTVDLQAWMQNALLWLNSLGVVGPIAFILIYMLATVFFVPGSLLTLGGGALFGVVLGSVYVFFGAVLGSTLAFLIGRYLARGWVAQRIEGNRKFKAIDEAVAREGARIVFLARLSPVLPFILLNYAFGITRVSLKDYLLGAIGMIPITITYVYIGSLAGNLATISTGTATATAESQTIQWVVRGVGLLATIAVTVYITHVAKKALDQSVASEGDVHATTDHR